MKTPLGLGVKKKRKKSAEFVIEVPDRNTMSITINGYAIIPESCNINQLSSTIDIMLTSEDIKLLRIYLGKLTKLNA